MASFTGKATGNYEAVGQTTWNEVSYPQAGDDFLTNAFAITQTQDEACAGGVISAGGELDIATFNLVNSIALVINGTLTGGVSADTGLTIAGFTATATAIIDWLKTTKIFNSGDVSIANVDMFTALQTGDFTQTESANFGNQKNTNPFESFTLDVGKTITLTVSSTITREGSNNTLINGIIAMGAYTLTIGANNDGSIVFGASSDVTGSGTIRFWAVDDPTYTNPQTLSFTGLWSFSLTWQDNCVVPAWDYSNGHVEIKGGKNTGYTRVIETGTLKTGDFKLVTTDSLPFTLDTNTYDPDLEISGDTDYNVNEDAVITIDKGDGTISLTNTATKTFKGDGQSIEAIIKSGVGITEIEDDFSTVSLSGTAGTIQSDEPGTIRVIAAGSPGVATGMTFKDISMGSENKVNAKAATNTNNGNNKGVVFVDSFGGF